MPVSFPEQDQDENTADASSTPEQDVNTPDAPSKSEETGEETMLDVVQAALDGSEESPTSQAGENSPDSDPKSESETEQDDASKEALSDEVTEEELKAATPNARRRIQDLVSQRKERDTEIDTLRPKAEGFDKVQQFVQAADLSSDEVNTGFELMALMKSNPAAALERLQPFVDELMAMTGQVLPPDLAEEVELGYITEQRARELSQARAGQKLATDRADQTEQRDEQRETNFDAQKHANGIASAVTSWETKKAAMDPDWTLKSDQVAEILKLTVHEQGFPVSEQDAIERAETALAAVEKRIKAYRPAPAAVQTNVTGEALGGRVQPEPTSLMDIVENVVG